MEKDKKFSDTNPSYYNDKDIEVWEMMVKIWGKEAFLNFCELNAFKYRMRMGNKPNQSVVKDLKKAKWYEEKLRENKDEKLLTWRCVKDITTMDGGSYFTKDKLYHQLRSGEYLAYNNYGVEHKFSKWKEFFVVENTENGI